MTGQYGAAVQSLLECIESLDGLVVDSFPVDQSTLVPTLANVGLHPVIVLVAVAVATALGAAVGGAARTERVRTINTAGTTSNAKRTLHPWSYRCRPIAVGPYGANIPRSQPSRNPHPGLPRPGGSPSK